MLTTISKMVLAVGLMASVCVGCAGSDYADSESSPNAAAQPEGNTSGEEGARPDQPVTRPQAQAVCTPQAQPLRPWPVEEIPSFLDRVLSAHQDGCSMDRFEIDVDRDGQLDEVLEVDRPAGDRLSTIAVSWTTQDPHLPMRTKFWRGVVSAERQGANVVVEIRAQADSSSAVIDVRRVYDADGHLLEERLEWDGAVWFVTTQEWDGDVLVAASLDDQVNGRGETRWEWSYDDQGRLLQGTVTNRGDEAGVEWSYDNQGRPARSIRTVSGEPYLEHAWVWGEGRALQSRSTKTFGRTNLPGAVMSPLDDVHGRDGLLWDVQSLEWANSTFRARKGDTCVLPPSSIVHGYPVAEGRVWDLGWALEDRPDGMGFAYGYNGYGYGYGQNSWFGHMGVGVAYVPFGTSEVFETEQTYDVQGRMIREEMTREPNEQNPLSSVRRDRVWSGDALESDTLIVEGPYFEWRSALEFTYDAQNRLVNRTNKTHGPYRSNNHPWNTLAVHTWSYDEAGHMVQHQISNHPHLQNFESVLWSFAEVEEPDMSLEPRVVTWGTSIHDNGHETFVQEGGAITIARSETTSNVRRGVLTQRLNDFDIRDDQGRVVEYGTGSFEDPTTRTSRVHNGPFLSVWETNPYGTNEGVREVYSMRCDAE